MTIDMGNLADEVARINEAMDIRTYIPTLALRIIKPVPDFGAFPGRDDGRLQQAWRCLETGEAEWRDIEVVRIDAGDEIWSRR